MVMMFLLHTSFVVNISVVKQASMPGFLKLLWSVEYVSTPEAINNYSREMNLNKFYSF